MKNYKQYSIFFLAFLLVFASCGRKDRFEKSPVDEIISKKGLLSDEKKDKPFSIILYDMDIDDSRSIYKHKYQIKEDIRDSTKKAETTDWIDVSANFAAAHLDHMGMELAARNESGEINRAPSPPGYHNAVGNERYGQWQTNSSGQSFWAFYGQYMFMSSMLHMATTPVYRNDYRGYQNYRTSNSTGAYNANGKYGTSSGHSRNMNKNFHASRSNKASSFKSKVASNPSKYRSSPSRTSRTGRSGGSSYRSRGGGFGK